MIGFEWRAPVKWIIGTSNKLPQTLRVISRNYIYLIWGIPTRYTLCGPAAVQPLAILQRKKHIRYLHNPSEPISGKRQRSEGSKQKECPGLPMQNRRTLYKLRILHNMLQRFNIHQLILCTA